jgi:hypothetical protein
LTEFPTFAEKGDDPMTAAQNKAVISSFVEEVLNQGRLERIDDLVAVDFGGSRPLPGQQQGREGLKQVISDFSHCVSRHSLGDRRDGGRRRQGI